MPAFERAFAEHDAEIAAVAAQAEAPTFANTIAAAGARAARLLERVAAVFFNLAGADTNDDLQAIEREIAPRLAAHNERILPERGIVPQRIDALHRAPDATRAEQRRARPLSQDVPARNTRAGRRQARSGWRR